MDNSSLERLARDGLVAYPPSDLPDLTSWCWDFAEATGDARYCSVGRLLQEMSDFWDSRGIPTDLACALDAAIKVRLPVVLAATNASDGAIQARLLREDIFRLVNEAGLF
jgi:hypothetical protein